MTLTSIPTARGSWQASLDSSLGIPHHISRRDWLEITSGSGVSESVAALNFASFGSGTALHWEDERAALVAHQRSAIATGSTTGKGFAQTQPGHVSGKLQKLDKRYQHLRHGGWRFLGDALPGHDATPRWKPCQPRIDARGRAVKYEAQPGKRPGLLLPRVPADAAALIAERHQLGGPAAGESFWQWALDNPSLPLVVVEGEKKACALISIGVAAVGLAGVDLGRVVERDDAGKRVSEQLTPELALLAAGDRQITIAFDADPKPATKRRVGRSAVRLGHCLAKAGAAVKVARLSLHNGDKCGPDDLLVANGAEALLKVLGAATALDERAWRRRRYVERRIAPTVKLKGASIPDDLPLPVAAVVGVRAPKGAGKTKALARWLADAPKVLSVTHRRTLGAAMAARLGLVWRNDTDSVGRHHFDAEGNCWSGIPPRYSLCVDSLLAVPAAAFAGGVVVLDEAEQVLAHLLTSTTCRDRRGLLIQRLLQIISNAAQVVALDADLSDATLNFLDQGGSDMSLISGAGKAPAAWPVHWYAHQRPEETQTALLKEAAAAPVFITTDSRERATALHELLQHHHPQAKGLLITSETTEKEETRAWLDKLTSLEALAAGAIRWVVASPSISSGLSIEHSYFRSVFGFFGAGTFDDGEAVQALARVRQPVPRHIWCSGAVQPSTPPLSKAWWPQQVEGDLRQRWNHQSAAMRQQLQPDLLMEPCPAEAAALAAAAAALWADLQSRRNYSLAHLRQFVRARLKAEGHQLIDVNEALGDEQREELVQIKVELHEQRQELHNKQVAAAPTITKAEAAKLQRHQPHHPALQRHRLLQRLALAPEALTPELVEWGEKWAGAAERLMLLFNPDEAMKRDLQRLQATTAQGEAPLPFDQSFKAQRSNAAEQIGLRRFIEEVVMTGGCWNSATPEVVKLAEAARQCRQSLELAMGLKVRAEEKKESNASLVGRLLRHFGITTAIAKTVKGERFYGAKADQLQMIKDCSKRLQQQASAGVQRGSEGLTKPAVLHPTTPDHVHAMQVLYQHGYVSTNSPQASRLVPSLPEGLEGVGLQQMQLELHPSEEGRSGAVNGRNVNDSHGSSGVEADSPLPVVSRR